MKKRAWKTRIKKACVEAGTYKPFFDHVIDTLAGILEKRDQAWDEYEESGDNLLVEMTNKSGHTNFVKHPLICLWDDLNKSALSYWKELGLTPAGIRKINEEIFIKAREEKNSNNLMDLLKTRQRIKENDG